MTEEPITAGQLAGRKEWLGLGVLALPCLLYSMDLTVLYLAIPRISAALRPSGAELLWMLDIYGFILAGFLIPMGSLGDRIGRRRLLLAGATAFGIASIFAALSTSAAMLIAARAILGVAAATLAPSTLSLIRNMFLDSRQRTLAISVWVTSFSAGAALGPLLGGLLLQHFWWGSVFLLAVPVMAMLLILGPGLLPEFRDPTSRRVDLVSAGLVLATVLPVIYAIKQLAQDGLTWRAGAPLVAGLIVGVAFVLRQQSVADPLLDLRLLRTPAFSAALAINLMSLLALGGVFMLIAQYFQLVVGLSPLAAGLWTLPSAAGLIVGSALTPLLVRRVIPQVAMAGGLLVAAAGFGLLSQVHGPSGLLTAAMSSVLLALGISPAVALATDLIVGAVPPEHAGMASGMSETSTELGGALGIALLGALALAVYRSQIAQHKFVTAAASNTLGAALTLADQMPATSGAMLRTLARDSFTQGLHAASLAGAAIALAAAILVRLVAQPTDGRR
jgi:DHA2 family multidrug resistance protein-like MFS transporter